MTASEFPHRIDAWITEDGRLHRTDTAAAWHQRDIDNSRIATGLIEAGRDLAHVLAAIDQAWHEGDDRDLLSQITKDTGLSISHWQCREEPGYHLVRREVGGGFFVCGYVGCWSGAYGASCSVSDIIRYARNTMKLNGGRLPKVWQPPHDRHVATGERG